MNSGPHASERRHGSLQFGLSDLLWFVLACSLWLSQLASSSMVLSAGVEPGLKGLLAAGLVWLGLAVCYVRFHSPDALIIHALVLIIVLILIIASGASARLLEGHTAITLLAQSCAANSIISFPCFVCFKLTRPSAPH